MFHNHYNKYENDTKTGVVMSDRHDELDLDLENELENDDDEFQDENDDENNHENEAETNTVPQKNKGGRPKSKKAHLMKISDPFQFAESYIMDNPTEPITMKIRRGGALLTEIDYSQDRSKMKFMTLSAIQKNFGAGIYSFEIFSGKTRRLIREPFSEQLLEHIDFMKIADGAQQEEVKKDNSNDILSSFVNLSKMRNENNDGPKREPDLIDNLARFAPLIPLAEKLFSALRPKEDNTTKELLKILVEKQMEQKPQQSSEEMFLKFKMIMKEEEEERERREQKMNDEIERRLAKEKELMGIRPEKSILEQAIDGLSSISKTVEASAKVKAIEAQQKLKNRNLTAKRPQTTFLPAKTSTNVVPSQKLDTIEVNNDLKLACEFLIAKFSELGGDEQKMIEFIKANDDLRIRLIKYDSNTICKEVSSQLNLSEVPEILRQGIENVYANIQSQ